MTTLTRIFCVAISSLLLLVPFSSVSVCDALSSPASSQGAASQKATVASTSSHQRVFVSTPSREIRRRVSDCMTPRSQMHTLTPDVSTDEAILLLLNFGISGAPVVDRDSGKLTGIISSSDFMFKDYAGALLNMEGSEEALNGVIEVAQKIVGSTVEELMSRQVVTIRSNEPMATAADIMARRGLHRLLVVDPSDDEELLGILTRSDVMRDVMSTVRAALPEHGTHYDDLVT